MSEANRRKFTQKVYLLISPCLSSLRSYNTIRYPPHPSLRSSHSIALDYYMRLRSRSTFLLSYVLLSSVFMYPKDRTARLEIIKGVVRRLMVRAGEEEAKGNWRRVVGEAKGHWLGPKVVDIVHGWGEG